jgi:hypothetical protein
MASTDQLLGDAGCERECTDERFDAKRLHRLRPDGEAPMSTPSSPPAATQSGTHDLPAYVSNGVVGLRVLDIPLLPGYCLVNGFAGTHPTLQMEAAATAPYPLAGDIALDGVWLTSSPHQAQFVDQAYDFETGELTTRFTYAGAGKTAHASVLTFCSRRDPTIVAQEVSVEVSDPCQLTLRAMVDPSHVRGTMVSRTEHVPGMDHQEIDGAMEWESLGGMGRCGLAYLTELEGDADATRTTPEWGTGSPLATEYAIRARPGRTYRLRQLVSVVPHVLHHDPDHAAIRLVAHAADDGFDEVRAANRHEWAELWKGRILIDAPDARWQQLADAAFFYMNTSVHPASRSSTSMYGLAMWNDYHYYYGHVMWDIEFFSVPPLSLLQPDGARALLEFRTQTIPAARSNARLNGRMGLQFPWEAGPINGDETAPGVGEASWHEDHVSLAVAWSFIQYAHAIGDRRFLAEDASRILYGVADWIASRVSPGPTPGSFQIVRSMGIAERQHPADNDAYTVMAARTVLRDAIATAEALGHSVAPAWREVLDGLHLRTSARTGAVMTHDGFHPGEEKGATPGPLAGIFPIWYDLDPAVERSTIEYYLRLADDYIGSPMLSPLYGVWAAWIGDRELSARLLEQGYAELIGHRFLQTLEMSPSRYPDKPRSGPFFANMGGFLMSLLTGFPGIRLGAGEPETWPSRPVVLPAGWKSIEVERAWIHRQPTRLIARHGAPRAEIIRPGAQSRRVA